MSGAGDARSDVAASARGLVRDVAARLDLEGVKEALARLERDAADVTVEAEVTSAVELTATERETIEDRLRRRHGKALTVRYRVEPAILGGLVVRVGDRYVDGSVAARLGQLRRTLVGTR